MQMHRHFTKTGSGQTSGKQHLKIEGGCVGFSYRPGAPTSSGRPSRRASENTATYRCKQNETKRNKTKQNAPPPPPPFFFNVFFFCFGTAKNYILSIYFSHSFHLYCTLFQHLNFRGPFCCNKVVRSQVFATHTYRKMLLMLLELFWLCFVLMWGVGSINNMLTCGE